MGDNIVDKNIVDKKYETIVHMVTVGLIATSPGEADDGIASGKCVLPACARSG